MPLKRRSRAVRQPALVVLCDVSGSMSRYSRMFLHFVHAVTNDRDRVHSFLFGTRLTNITRYLRHRDVDVAVGRASRAVRDWSGGTRIGPCLKDFNHYWSRRVLAQGALVLLITDGLDRDDLGILQAEVERLHMSCRRLIWLNPLLRYEGFRPEAGGVRTILPHIDDFRPVPQHRQPHGHRRRAERAPRRRPSQARPGAERAAPSGSRPTHLLCSGAGAQCETGEKLSWRHSPELGGIKWDKVGFKWDRWDLAHARRVVRTECGPAGLQVSQAGA